MKIAVASLAAAVASLPLAGLAADAPPAAPAAALAAPPAAPAAPFASTAAPAPALPAGATPAAAVRGPVERPDAERAPVAPAVEEPYSRTALFLELGGTAFLWSINVDRRISRDFGLRVGFSYLSLSASESDEEGTMTAKASLTMVPVQGTYLVGGRNSKLELGAGAMFLFASAEVSGALEKASESATTVAPTGVVGYRYQPADGGFLFRVGIAPTMLLGTVIPMPGISFGGAF